MRRTNKDIFRRIVTRRKKKKIRNRGKKEISDFYSYYAHRAKHGSIFKFIFKFVRTIEWKKLK